MSLSQAAAQGMLLRSLFSEIGFSFSYPLTLYGDNKGSIDIATNPVITCGTKHIDICHHYIRQCISSDSITVQRLPSSLITADVLTKPLSASLFYTHRVGLGLVNCVSSMGGC